MVDRVDMIDRVDKVDKIVDRLVVVLRNTVMNIVQVDAFVDGPH